MAKYTVRAGDMNRSAIATGKKARASAGSRPDGSALVQAVTELQRLIDLVQANQQTVPEAQEVQSSAIKAQKELKSKRPNFDRVREILSWISGTVSGVDALADIVTKIQQLIPHV
jgi:hypothetical protein